MEVKQYTTVDKTEWVPGDWHNEPDKIQWPDPETGLPCLIVRGPSGALCGYVGVPDTHPWHAKEYGARIGDCNENCRDDDHYGHRIDGQIEVHGGLTFSDACAHSTDESRHICHVPAPGEPDNVWWFGFDCAHSGDICPKYLKEFGPFGRSAWESYRTVAYVRNEVRKLAQQLAAVRA